MGLLDGFFGKRHDKVDWLQFNFTTWNAIGITNDGVQYSLDRSSCYESGGMVWWKQRIGIPGKFFEYSICAGAIPEGLISLVITRTLSDPGLKMLKKDELRQMLRPGVDPLFDKALQNATTWARAHDTKMPPPCFYYGLSILDE